MIYQTRPLSISIDCPAESVYDFVLDPANLPRWATAFCQSVSRTAEQWTVETPDGPVHLQFAERNTLGVLDHVVRLASGSEVYVPMRVIRNGSGSELIFVLFRSPDLDESKFLQDIQLVEQDLNTLKALLESPDSANLRR